MYEQLLAALQATGLPLAEYAWDTNPAENFLVVSIDGQGGTMSANDQISEQAVEGSIDLYCYDNDRANIATIQNILNGLSGCAWRMNSVQYEPETRLIHWEWVFQLAVM